MKIGIIGNGFVGNAVYQNVKEKFNTLVYDKDESRSLNALLDTVSCDLVFVCLPTPMKQAEGGECNLSIIENFFKELPTELNGIFIIKSTVPIGTAKRLQDIRKDLRIVHNPEFLTAINAVEDFKKSERNVIGGETRDTIVVAEFLETLLPKAKNLLTTSDESEAIKYFSNTFLAVKVAYFNIVFDLATKLNLNYDAIIRGISSDSRIGSSHTKVPGPDGDRGFGGTCFPKDINALMRTLEANGVNSKILQEVWEYNKEIRKDWDWVNNKSAVNDEG
jgi:UDPglucose 6-dehydrogenase